MASTTVQAKADNQLDSMLVEFLEDTHLPDKARPNDSAVASKPARRRSRPKPKPKAKGDGLTLKQKVMVDAYLDKSNPKTYSNKTQSALVAYNIAPDNTNLAGQVGHDTLKIPKVQNYLERRCEEMGIGVEVRVDTLRQIVKGEGVTKTTIKHKTKAAGDNEFKVTRIQEVETPPRVHDRIIAIKEINSMTGYYKQQEIDKQIALSEVRSMYDKIVGTGKNRARGEKESRDI